MSIDKKRKTISCPIILIIFLVIAIPLGIEYCKQWNFNQGIIKSQDRKIELQQIKNLNLWDMTIKNIKSNNKYIEVKYDNYQVTLNSEKIEQKNKLELSVKHGQSDYERWKDQDILEIDVSKVQPYNLVEQIELNNSKLLKDLKKIDIYGIRADDKKIEYIETKEIQDDITVFVCREEYERYVMVYVPIAEIEVEKEEIELFKNESYQMQIKLKPESATTKMVHIDDLKEGSPIQIKEDGVIQGLEVGTEEFCIEAEEGAVEKKIKVIVKAKVEGIQVESEKIQLTEGESKKIEAKVLPEEIEDKTLNYVTSDAQIAKIDQEGKIEALKEGEVTITITTNAEPPQERKITVIVNKKQEKVEEPPPVQVQTSDTKDYTAILQNYVRGVLIVNKQYSLPSNYDPGTNAEAQEAFNKMKQAAQAQGISLKIVSGYRSYQTQQAIYQRNVQIYGEEVANSFSAKPGQSEHQTGLAFDVNSTRWNFKDTVEAKWLADNCDEYGFIIRYPENKQEKTGYVYEPWHVRYVGKDLAKQIKESGLCLEEYLGIVS